MRAPMEDVRDAAVRAGVARVRAAVADAARRSGRDAATIRILAAVKYVDAAAAAVLVESGIVDLAENRLQALEQRRASADLASHAAALRWHYIGRLQSRQAPRIAGQVDVIHTLCTASAAARLDTLERLPELLVQVNVDGDPGKDGLEPSAVESFLTELPARVRVSGFMTMPAAAASPGDSRRAFAALRELRDRLAPRLGERHPLTRLSMGTSQDFVVAVEEGATDLRLGRTLFVDGE